MISRELSKMEEEVEVGGNTMSAGELDFENMFQESFFQFLQQYHGRRERKRTLQN